MSFYLIFYGQTYKILESIFGSCDYGTLFRRVIDKRLLSEHAYSYHNYFGLNAKNNIYSSENAFLNIKYTLITTFQLLKIVQKYRSSKGKRSLNSATISPQMYEAVRNTRCQIWLLSFPISYKDVCSLLNLLPFTLVTLLQYFAFLQRPI